MSASQNEAILQALQSGQRITAIDALEQFKCFRLAARVHDLRKAGHDIQEEIITRDGKRYAKYFIPQWSLNQGELVLA